MIPPCRLFFQAVHYSGSLRQPQNALEQLEFQTFSKTARLGGNGIKKNKTFRWEQKPNGASFLKCFRKNSHTEYLQ